MRLLSFNYKNIYGGYNKFLRDDELYNHYAPTIGIYITTDALGKIKNKRNHPLKNKYSILNYKNKYIL